MAWVGGGFHNGPSAPHLLALVFLCPPTLNRADLFYPQDVEEVMACDLQRLCMEDR